MPATLRKAKLGAKSQVTLPKDVRQALGLKQGDTLAFAIDGEDVRLLRVPARRDGPLASFTEWASDADSDGYAKL